MESHMKRSKTVHTLGRAAIVGAMMALTGTSALAEESVLVDNWNTAGCSYTDSAPLSVTSSVHLKRIDLWFNWNTDETSLSYTLMSGNQKVTSGTLSRGDCDPYQASWCVARGKPDVDLAPGEYTVQVESARVCQNGGSGGKGFIKAYGEPASGSVQTGTSASSSDSESASSSEPEVPTGTAVKIAAVTVLGSVLIAFGAAVATGFSGLGGGNTLSTLTDVVKGKLPSDGFDVWKEKTESSGKVYGSGSSDDPYRDYPDADNPPWKPQYGDGTTTSPYSDTAPPVIETDGGGGEGGGSEPVYHTSVDLHPTLASGPTASDTAPIVAHIEPIKPKEETVKIESDDDGYDDDSVDPAHVQEIKAKAAAKDIDGYDEGSDTDRTDTLEKLLSCSDKLKDLITAHINAGDFIGNDTNFDKFYNAPSYWLGNKHYSECQEAFDWGATLGDDIHKTFGEDAVYTEIKIANPLMPGVANHIANLVVLPNGQRFVIDVWDSMIHKEPKIYREDEWIDKWHKDFWVSRDASVTRGVSGVSEMGRLDDAIRERGVEPGIEHYLNNLPLKASEAEKQEAIHMVASYRAHPWPTGPSEKDMQKLYHPGIGTKLD
jgi:hypothetical protein